MEISINENYNLILRKVFNPVILETEEKQRLSVCMRDSGYEIKIQGVDGKDQLIIIRDGKFEFPNGDVYDAEGYWAK